MARFDKYNGVSGGFRAPLLAAVVAADLGGVVAVSLDTAGKVVRGGAGNTGMVGVICPDKTMAAGDVIDVMTQGEIADFNVGANGGAFASVAGTNYFASATTGVLDTTAPAAGTNKPKIGHTVELTRLIVRFREFQG